MQRPCYIYTHHSPLPLHQQPPFTHHHCSSLEREFVAICVREREREMEGKEEDVRLGANKFTERQPIGTAAQGGDKDYKEPPPAPLFEPSELTSWSFYRAGIAEFMATFLFLYITILTVMGVVQSKTKCSTVGIQGIAWSFGGMIFALVYCTAGISGGHINPAVTFGLLLARKLSLTRAVFYMVMQCLGAICGAAVVKGFQSSSKYVMLGGGANVVNPGYTKGDGLGAEIVGTFVLVYTVFSATDAKRSARDSHVPILAPLPIGFAVFLVHLATIPITGTGINPARSLGAAIVYNKDHAWDDHWIFWVGPFIGAALAALYHQVVIRAIPFKAQSKVDGWGYWIILCCICIKPTKPGLSHHEFGVVILSLCNYNSCCGKLDGDLSMESH
ncbi:unnamed protein product [Camellia sinensis]